MNGSASSSTVSTNVQNAGRAHFLLYFILLRFICFFFFFPWRFEHQFQFLWPPIKNTYRRGRERERGQATGIWGPGRELDA